MSADGARVRPSGSPRRDRPALPRWGFPMRAAPAQPASDWPTWLFDYRGLDAATVTSLADAALEAAEAEVALAVDAAMHEGATFDAVIGRMDRALASLWDVHGPTDFQVLVHPDEEVRVAAQATEQRMNTWRRSLPFRDDVADAVTRYAGSSGCGRPGRRGPAAAGPLAARRPTVRVRPAGRDAGRAALRHRAPRRARVGVPAEHQRVVGRDRRHARRPRGHAGGVRGGPPARDRAGDVAGQPGLPGDLPVPQRIAATRPPRDAAPEDVQPGRRGQPAPPRGGWSPSAAARPGSWATRPGRTTGWSPGWLARRSAWRPSTETSSPPSGVAQPASWRRWPTGSGRTRPIGRSRNGTCATTTSASGTRCAASRRARSPRTCRWTACSTGCST